MTFELRPGDKAGIIAPSRWLKGPDDLTAGPVSYTHLTLPTNSRV